MDGQITSNRVQEGVNDFYLPSEEHIRKLRKILWSEGGYKFSYKETEEISYQLISLYECLARGKQIKASEGGYESG